MQDFLIANSAQLLLGTFLGGVALVMLLESLAPLRAVSPTPMARWCYNLLLATLTYATLFGVVPLVSVLLVGLMGMEDAGLLHRLNAGPVVSFVLVLLCLELAMYGLHRASHAVPLLWRVHAVHHSDTEVDATTAYRHHPLEALVSTVVTIPVLVLLGPDLVVLLAYNLLYAMVTVLGHGNFSIGRSADRVLRLFVVTPDFHRMHHSAERRYTDSNFANLLPLFDHLFGTASQGSVEQGKNMPLGLEYFREPKYARLDQLLLMPFQPEFGRATRTAD